MGGSHAGRPAYGRIPSCIFPISLALSGDFGFAKIVAEGGVNTQFVQTYKCTPIYASPQMLKSEAYSSKTDIWSLGVLLFEMIYGKYPFHAKDMTELLNQHLKVKDQGIEFPADKNIDASVKSLIQNLLRYSEKDRYSIDQVLSDEALKKDMKTNFELPQIEDKNVMGMSIAKNQMKTFKAGDNMSTFDTGVLIQKNVQHQKCEEKQKHTEQLGSESNQYDQNIQQILQKEVQDQIIARQSKLFNFLSSQALFANITMQHIWAYRQNYKFNQFLINMMVYYLSAFYNYCLDYTKQILNQAIPYKLTSQQDFLVYQQSEKFQKQREKINTDAEQASSFFSEIKASVLLAMKETQQQKDLDEASQKQIKDFILFADSKNQSFLEYQQRYKNNLNQQLKNYSLESLDKLSLKGIVLMIMFAELQKYFAFNKYEEFDMRCLLDNYINQPTLEEMIAFAKTYIKSIAP